MSICEYLTKFFLFISYSGSYEDAVFLYSCIKQLRSWREAIIIRHNHLMHV